MYQWTSLYFNLLANLVGFIKKVFEVNCYENGDKNFNRLVRVILSRCAPRSVSDYIPE